QLPFVLYLAEVGEGFEVAAVGGGLVAKHQRDLGIVLVGFVAVGKGDGQVADRALGRVGAFRHLVNKNYLGRAGGLVLFAERVEVLLGVFLMGIVQIGGNFGAESMAECVLSDGVLAFRGAWSRRFLGIFTICFNLCFGGHKYNF